MATKLTLHPRGGAREKKGLPDGHASVRIHTTSYTTSHTPSHPSLLAPPTDDGYTSEADEPPESYFEGMSRDRDRKQIPDPAIRKFMRKTAKNGWAAIPSPPASFVRQTEHVYNQTGPHCAAHCAAFISLRYLGFTVVQTIARLGSLNKAGKLAAWQTDSASSIKKRFATQGTSEYSNFMADRMSNILEEICEEAHLYTEKLSLTDAARLALHQSSNLPRPEILFPQIIGQFPRTDWSLQGDSYLEAHALRAYFHTTIKKGANAVRNMPPAPSSAKVSTFQAALFSNLQPCRSTAVPHPLRKDPKVPQHLIRSATPFVQMDIFALEDNGRPDSHAIVVDFSDPQHPGIFDPNFGWMAPTSGFCHLDFEQALNSLWEYYTRNISRVSGKQGLGTLNPDLQPGIFFYASQIYVQSLPPAPDLKKPPPRK